MIIRDSRKSEPNTRNRNEFSKNLQICDDYKIVELKYNYKTMKKSKILSNNQQTFRDKGAIHSYDSHSTSGVITFAVVLEE